MSKSFVPAYLKLLDTGELSSRVEKAYQHLENCDLWMIGPNITTIAQGGSLDDANLKQVWLASSLLLSHKLLNNHSLLTIYPH